MRRAVVLQWSRLGDVLQTRVLLRALRSSASADRVTLCADARYAAVARLFPEVDDFWPVDMAHLSALARHSSAHGTFLRSMTVLPDGINEDEVRHVFVLSRSLAAAICAELLHPRRIEGYRQTEGCLVPPEPIEWIEARMRRGAPLDVHIADAWAALCRHHHPSDWLRPLALSPGEGTCRPQGATSIALVCDAGEPYRRMPSAYLCGLAESLLSDFGINVELHGATVGADQDDLEPLLAQRGVTDYRGRLTIDELCARLSASSLVIGSDTGALHLAAAFGVPVVGLYSAGAMPHFTGPYASNAIVLLNPVWTQSNAKQVASLAWAVLSNEPVKRMPSDVAAFTPALDEHGVVFAANGVVGTAGRKEFFARFGCMPTAGSTTQRRASASVQSDCIAH